MSRFTSLLSVCLGSLLLSGCSKQASEPMPVEQAPPSVATVEPDGVSSPAELPAESSLALKRGTLSLASEHATFRLCAEETQLWVIDQTENVLRDTFKGESLPLELYVEAYGERMATPANVAAARAYGGLFILEEVLYAAPSGETRGCEEAAPAYVVAARGNEPFWSIEVADDKLTWRQPEAPQELVFDAVQSEDAEGTVGYSGSVQDHTIEVFITAESCRDSMSGAYFAYSARATFDGRQLTGCARIGG
jgi:uncharacterized membrane protein